MSKKEAATVEIKSTAAAKVDERVTAVVNAPLEVAKLVSGEAFVCEPCGRILAVQKPGEKLATVGGEALEKVPECPGVEAKEHGPWPHTVFVLDTVTFNKATGRALGGIRAKG